MNKTSSKQPVPKNHDSDSDKVSSAHQLENSIGFMISVTARSMRNTLEGELKSYGLTPTQWAVLVGVDSEACDNQSDLSNMLNIDNATVTRQIERLAKMGLIRRRRNRNDRRAQTVHLTPKARELLPELSKIATQVNKRAMKGMGEGQMTRFFGWLEKIRNNLDSV